VPVVKELVAHILHHVDAEDATRDQSQAAGVADRAQYVRDAVRNLTADTKDSPTDSILQTISDDALLTDKQTSFQRAITNMKGESRPQLAIQTWVGKAREGAGG
jgi:hypothetical protein